MTTVRLRLADAARSLGTALTSGGRGASRTARRGARGIALGARVLVRRRRGTAALLGLGIARVLLQVPVDALLMLLARLVSALQTILGIETPGRPLDADERALLERVFGRGIDARPVRLKVGRLGLLGLPRRAFVVGDTIYVPGLAPGSLARRAPSLLVHELVHVWQHQRQGTRYMSECLLAQWFGEGYNVAIAVAAGRRWYELNFEQQAELLERAFDAGWIARDRAPVAGARLFVRLTNPRRDDGFAVRLAHTDEREILQREGWADATPLLLAGLAAVGRGVNRRSAGEPAERG